MALQGSGFDIPGEWFIAGAPASATSAAGAAFGSSLQLTVDNRTSPAKVHVQSALVSPAVAEFYSLIVGNTVLNAGTAAIFNTDGPASGTAYIQRITPFSFGLTGNSSILEPAYFEISWQLSVLEAAAQTQIRCITGTMNLVPGNALVPGTLASRTGSADDLLTGSFVVRVTSATATFAIVNTDAGNLTLKGSGGGTDAVSATLVIRRLQ